jgi:hypothetical protein
MRRFGGLPRSGGDLMRKWIGAGLGVLLAAGAGSVAAAPQKTSTHKASHKAASHKAATHKAAAPREASDEQVRQLIEVSGVDRMLEQMNTQMAAMMRQQMPCVPASYWQGFIDAKGVQELTGRMVPVYRQYFSAADVEGLLRFYRSPLGRKVVTQMPGIMTESMRVGQAWGQERTRTMLADLQKSGRIDAEGRCPATAGAPGADLAAPAAAGSAGH